MHSTDTMDMGNDIRNRHLFDAVATTYDRTRPTYPPELFSALKQEAHLTAQSRLLEVGPGTGQATLPLAKMGCPITAVELGEKLAAILRHKVEPYPNVEVIVGDFDKIDMQGNHYDLVLAATAFHWLDRGVRYSKPYTLLKPNGKMAIIGTHHVSDGAGDRFFRESMPIYERYMQTKSKTRSLPIILDITAAEDFRDDRFVVSYFKCFPYVVEYSAHEYADLLGTYSPQLALPIQKRQEFLAAIQDLIVSRFNGTITKHYAMSLTVADKR